MNEKAKVKLDPVRIVIPKYGFAPALLLEYFAGQGVVGFTITDNADYLEVIVPLTKQSIRPLLAYINGNI